MRRLLPIIAILLLPACATTNTASTPSPAPDPMANANVFILQVHQAPDEAYRDMAAYLSEHGFGIAHSDDTLLALTTEKKEVRGSLGSYTLNIHVESGDNTRIIVTGSTHSIAGARQIKLDSGFMEGKMRKLWHSVDKLLIGYPHEHILYARK